MQSPPKPLIYLASASPRRSALLAQIGVPHRIAPVAVDERVLVGEPPEQYVRRLAELKAQTLWRQVPERDRTGARQGDWQGNPAGDRAGRQGDWRGNPAGDRLPVLAADTAVVIEGEILGKPADEGDCLRMLRLLSGRTHQVHTAVALQAPAGIDARLNVSEVAFRELTTQEMQCYWRTGEPADKAGGYAVQGLAAAFIRRIAGSYSGIMGLPLYETAELLATIGWTMSGSADGSGAGVHSEVRG